MTSPAKLRFYQDALREKTGITLDMPEWEKYQRIDALVQSRFIYTLDQDIPTDLSMGIYRGNAEQWLSYHDQLLTTDKKVKGDCDDFGNTGIELACIAGCDQTKLAQVLVVDTQTAKRESLAPIQNNMNHHIGGAWLRRPGDTNHKWFCVFDTWGQDDKPSIVSIDERGHLMIQYALVSEGLLWRDAPGILPYKRTKDLKAGTKKSAYEAWRKKMGY